MTSHTGCSFSGQAFFLGAHLCNRILAVSYDLHIHKLVSNKNRGPKRDSNHCRQMTLLKKQTLYQPSHHGWLNLDNLFPLISCGNNLNKSKLGIIFYCNKKSFSLDIHFNTLKHKRIWSKHGQIFFQYLMVLNFTDSCGIGHLHCKFALVKIHSRNCRFVKQQNLAEFW